MSLIRKPELPQLKTIIGEKKNKNPTEQKPVKPARCLNCGNNYFLREGPETKAYEKNESMGFCSNQCRVSWLTRQDIYSDDDDDLDEAVPISLASYGAKQGGMRGGATEITDNTLEKKLIDATAPYNEKAARNAENFAKASIEVGKAILAQLKLDPFAFINNAKNLGIKISEITKEGIFLLFPGNNAMEEPIERLVESGTKLYFLPVRILGTIAITIFLSMFDVFIPLKFLEKIPGLKPFIDLVMKYSAIIPTMVKGINIPNLSLGSLIDSDVMDASFLKDGTKYEYKSKKGGRKKKRTRRKKRRKN